MKKINNIDVQEIIVSVIIVTHNDAKIIEKFIRDVNVVLTRDYPNYEILIVDNNSSDDTINKIRNLYQKILHIRIVQLSKIYNSDIAFTAGLDYCIGDYVVLLDIRIVNPSKIPLFLNELIKGYDVVTSKSEKPLLSKWSASYIFLSIVEKLSTHDFSYEPVFFLGLSRKAVNSITRIRRKSRNFSYLIYSIGFKKISLPYRLLGIDKSKIKTSFFFELVVAVANIIISNSFRPIRMIAAMGIIMSCVFLLIVFTDAILALFLKIYVIPPGWTSIAIMIGVMFFLLFSLLMIMTEYLIRVLQEVRNEPLYFIAGEFDKSVININDDKLNIIL